jgi:HK97 family phage major capsid protein
MAPTAPTSPTTIGSSTPRAVLANNFTPNAHIVAPRTVTSLGKLKGTTNAYLQTPPNMLPVLVTKQLPINLTVGTSSDASYLFTAAWDQLLVGIRTDCNLRFLGERYLADSLTYAFLAYMRADIQLAQPAAFVVDTGVRG